MKKILSILLAVTMALSSLVPLSLSAFSEENAAFAEEQQPSGAKFEQTLVSLGKTATLGSVKAENAKLTDGVSTTNNNYVDSTNYGLVTPRENVSRSTCYAEIDLGREYPVSAVNTVTYVKGSRVYKWDVYLARDNTRPIDEWTLAGGKTTDEVSTYDGYTVEFQPVNARYVRVYGTANSDNTSFHWLEIFVYALLNNVSGLAPAVTGTGAQTALLTDGVRDNASCVDILWGSTAGSPASSFGTAGSCFVQIDLGEICNVTDVNVANYAASGRYYRFSVYGTNDPALPIGSWRLLGEKSDNVISLQDGYTVSFDKTPVRYIRVYGLYNSANTGYHFSEISVFTGDTVKTPVSHGGEAVTGSGADASALTDGILTEAFEIGHWGSDASEASSAYGLNGACYAEIDLGASLAVFSLSVLTPDKYHLWAAYASNDASLPAEQWTLLGEKSAAGSSALYEIGFTEAEYRYIRVYGLYNPAGAGFYANEIEVFADASYTLPEIGFEIAGGFENIHDERAHMGFSTVLALRVTGGFASPGALKEAIGSGAYRTGLVFTDAYGAPFEIFADPAFYDGDDLWYFEPCLAGFVPVKGQIYDVRLNLYDASETLIASGTSGGALCACKPVYVYDGAYEPAREIISWYNGTAATLIDGSAVLTPFGIHERYLQKSDAEEDGFDLSSELRFFVNGVEYGQMELNGVTGTHYGARRGTLDAASSGFAPCARIASDISIEVYTHSYPSGNEVLEAVYYLPSFTASDEVIDSIGHSYAIYESQGDVVVGYSDKVYSLEATGTDIEGCAFAGWYLDGALVSTQSSYSFSAVDGEEHLIVGMYGPAAKKPLERINLRVYKSKTVTGGASAPSLSYEFHNDLVGSAAGTVTFTPSSAGSYELYWLDASGAKLTAVMNGKALRYSALTEMTLSAGETAKYTVLPFTALPYGAQKLAVFKGAQMVLSVALPEEKLLSGTYEYAYGLMSDLHYNSFPKYVEGGGETDYAIDAANAAYTYFREAGVTNVFQTGDYSTYEDEVAYQRYAAGVSASGLLVLAAGGNHEVISGSSKMFSAGGLWYKYVNLGVYNGQVPGVVEIAPNGYDFVYEKPGTDDIFVFVSQEKWDGRTASQSHLVTLDALSWLADVFETYKDRTVHLMLHTYLSDDDGEDVDGEGDITNSVGYGYHYHYNVHSPDEKILRALLDEYRNVIWFNGHSHWICSMQDFNVNLNIFDYYGTSATCVHVPSVTAPRSVTAAGTAYSSNAGKLSEGTLVMRANGYEIINGVDFKTGELLSYGCYIVYDENTDGFKQGGEMEGGTNYLYDAQTSSLVIAGQGDMPDFDDPSDAPYAEFANGVRRIYVSRGVTGVGKNAFAGFTTLETVEIKDTVVTLNENCFRGDGALGSLYFTDSVKTVKENAFAEIGEIGQIRFGGSAEGFEKISVGSGNDALSGGVKEFDKAVITFVYGDIRDSVDVKKGDVPIYEGNVYKKHEDPDKIYVFAGWTDGLICFADALPAVTGNAVYYALFNEADGISASGRDRYIEWTLDGHTGELTISGYGPMADYEDPSQTPWSAYGAQIRSIVVKKGVLSIGKNAFRGLTNAVSVKLETKLIKIGECAMMGMTALKEIYLPSTLKFGAKRMAYQSSALQTVYYDGTEEEYRPYGEIFRLWGNNEDFAPDGGKLVYNVSITYEQTYTVTFLDDDGTVIVTYHNVNRGASVVPPEMSDRDGEYFLGWNGSYRDVTGDLVLTAVYSSEPDPDIDVEIEPKSLTVKPYYGKIENYSGATYFITGTVSDDNEALFAYLKSGAMKLKVILKDENTGRSYIVDEYRFDHPGTEFYATSFLRLNFCPYGVVPEASHAYTVTLEVYSGKNTIYRGVSETGAFLTTNDAFISSGAIVGTVNYSCTVVCTVHERADGGDCETEGVCLYCNQTLPAGAHTPVTDPRVAPTATKAGLTEGSHCAVCGKVLVAQQVIPATGVTGVNVALHKSVKGVGGGKAFITDGDTSVSGFWDGGLYPSAAVVDLAGFYDLSDINVVTYHGDGRYYRFSVYVSTDGRSWSLVGSKTDTAAATEEGTDFEVRSTARYVKVEITYNSKNTSAHLVEVMAYGVKNEEFEAPEPVYTDPSDPSNVAYGKPVTSNSFASLCDLVNDGDASTVWSSYYFPSYVDIDLLSNYELSKITVIMPSDGYTYSYAIYGSLDGVNFEKIAQTGGLESSPANGKSFTFEGVSCRIVRVNVTACGGGTYKPAKIAEIKVYGAISSAPVTETRTGMSFTGYDEWLLSYAGVDLAAIKDENGRYDPADTYTEADTVNELNGIVTRLLGAEYISWFDFDVAENPTSSGKDFFKIEDEEGKIRISGSDGTCIAAGLNWYLKYYCGVHISQETAQVRMPSSVVPVVTPVFMETAQHVRYAYNYCTLSYTMAFYGYDDWRRELDWLFLNGVNVILDITGIEALWVSYLQKLGYTADEAKNYACGPGYKAWWLMGNLENYNGTVSDLYVEDSLEMARRNQRSMTVMGAMPALQTFVGAMPDSFGFLADPALTEAGFDHVAAYLVSQGIWQGYDRPNVLRTDYDGYSYLANLFYETEDELFGQITDYYCGDVCHEGGKIPTGLTKADMSAVILAELMAHNEEGKWMLQRWQSNPTRAELDGMSDYKTTNVIVIDLASARDTSKWKNTSTYGAKEFGATNWIFSSLDNFGGRPLMHGALQTVVNNMAEAKAQANYMVGVGMTPEGTQNNPVYYDLYWEMVWRDTAPNVSEWIEDYVVRRYGGTDENLKNAWAQLLSSVYAYPNTNGTSGNFMVIGNKPRFDSYVGSYYEVQYSNRTLLTALTYMMADFEEYADNECYIYDLVEIMQTYLANKAQNYISIMIQMAGAPQAYDYDEFVMLCDRFLEVIMLEDEISSYSANQLTGKWIGRVDEWVNDARTGDYDDYMIDTMKTNAKMLITSWTSTGVLIDYANRLYNGLTADYYREAWAQFLENAKTRFAAGQSSSTQALSSASYLACALEFILNDVEYQSVVSAPRGGEGARGIGAIYREILENHAPESFEPTVNENDQYEQFGGISKMFSSVEFYSATNQFECWPFNDNGTWSARASFHTLIRVNDSGLNYLAANLGTPNYPYTWKFYYQEKNTENTSVWTGPYTATVETKSSASFLRLQVSDCPEGDFCENFEAGKSYTLLFDVWQNGASIGFGVLDFTWNAKYEANHDLYTDFWLNHDRSTGYTSGKQTVTDRDKNVAAALGFSTSGAYSQSSHSHSFGEWTAAGVSESGQTLMRRVCTSCGYTEQKKEADHEHVPTADPAVAPTCASSGLTAGTHCAVCGLVLEEQTVVPALAHTWNEGVVTRPATYQQTGEMTYTCLVCGATETETIPRTERPLGDLSGNGALAINDVSLLLDALSHGDPYNYYADVNSDGEIDIRDVSALLDLLSGKKH